MSTSRLRRLFVVGLTLGLCLLPIASAHAAPREETSDLTIDLQIQQFGRILWRSIERFVSGPQQPQEDSAGKLDDPGETDGVGIDPFGR
jgi:hypothetical protein